MLQYVVTFFDLEKPKKQDKKNGAEKGNLIHFINEPRNFFFMFLLCSEQFSFLNYQGFDTAVQCWWIVLFFIFVFASRQSNQTKR